MRVWLGKVRDSGLNMAVSAALTVDLMSQARELVRRIRRIPGASEQWKMVSVLVGHNDLCYKSCKGFLNNFIPRTRVSVEDYEKNLRKGVIGHKLKLLCCLCWFSVLKYLRSRLSKTVVLLLTPADVTLVDEVVQVMKNNKP